MLDDARHDPDFQTLTPLVQSQRVMTRMLKLFAHTCERHGISYVLMYGTLLGAVRHQGFIPWDCDVDVGVRAEDFPRLKKILMTELPDDIFFQDRETDSHYHCDIPKLRDRYSNYYEWAKDNPQYRHHNGLQLDIFIYHLREDGHTRYCPFVQGERFENDDLFGTTQTGKPRLPFHGQMMQVPPNYIKVLGVTYDSLDEPPMHDRIPHEGATSVFSPCKHPESRNWHL
jgi:phosphorylcholine metabolism protein LicD